jgi:D-alanyl-D-alanine carboxypeptidase/D-alanyl-D-alanine-endopeptidase (penicillin-binding protein 4)
MRSCWPAALILFLLAPCSAPTRADDDPPGWKKDVDEVLHRPEYKPAHWGLLVCDAKTGEVLEEKNADKLFAPASVTKLFTVSAAWATFGPDFKFQTHVYRRGEVNKAGILHGDLILLASGDLTMGGRTNAEGKISFRNGDHTYANGNNTAQLTDEDPLTGLDELAETIHAAGINRVTGDVLIDARMFEAASSTGSGPEHLSPMLINDNVVDFLVTPGESAGEPAEVSSQPDTDMVAVDASVETIAKGEKPNVTVHWASPGKAVVRGKIPVGHAPIVRVLEWHDPEFAARGMFIEALRNAEITVDASLYAEPNSHSLPSHEWYEKATTVATLESVEFAENAKLILKVSHNLHASTLPLLLAARHGKKSLAAGLQIEGEELEKLGVDLDAISFGGGAGGDRADHVTPRAVVQLLRGIQDKPEFEKFPACLPILGVDGTLSTAVGRESPAKGKAYAKTGTLYWDNGVGNRTLLLSKGLGGYIDARSGRRLVFAFFVNLTQLPNAELTAREGKALGRLAEIFQQAF